MRWQQTYNTVLILPKIHVVARPRQTRSRDNSPSQDSQ